jgi:hypothetical protein
MNEERTSDRVRQYTYDNYVIPARNSHRDTATVRAGDVAKAMRMRGRLPQVCGAIGTVKFQKQFGLRLIQRSGPANGSNTIFTFEV